MNADDEVCMCFHVSFRKLLNFVRQRQPKRASELSNCFNAGTGCGWCRTVLHKIAEVPYDQLPEVQDLDHWVAERFPDSIDNYAKNRAAYRVTKLAKNPKSADEVND
jgi:bacterioferritin-associated ferredoxin